MAAQKTDVNVNPADETIHLGPLTVRFLITGDDANGSLAAVRADGARGAAAGSAGAQSRSLRRNHLRHRGGADVDRGRQADRRRTRAGPLHSARRHAPVRQPGSQDVKALCAITPAAIGPQYFRESAAVLNAAAGGPPDQVKMADIMRRHGLTPAA